MQVGGHNPGERGKLDQPNVEVRSVDGQHYREVERRRTVEELETVFDRAGFSVEFGHTEWFIDLVATRR